MTDEKPLLLNLGMSVDRIHVYDIKIKNAAVSVKISIQISSFPRTPTIVYNSLLWVWAMIFGTGDEEDPVPPTERLSPAGREQGSPATPTFYLHDEEGD